MNKLLYYEMLERELRFVMASEKQRLGYTPPWAMQLMRILEKIERT